MERNRAGNEEDKFYCEVKQLRNRNSLLFLMNWRFHTTLAFSDSRKRGVELFQQKDYNLEDMARNVGSARRISYDDSAFRTGSFSNICWRELYRS